MTTALNGRLFTCCLVYFCFHYYLCIITFTAIKTIPFGVWWNCLQIVVICFWTWFSWLYCAPYDDRGHFFNTIGILFTNSHVFNDAEGFHRFDRDHYNLWSYLIFVLQKSSTCFAFNLLALDYVVFLFAVNCIRESKFKSKRIIAFVRANWIHIERMRFVGYHWAAGRFST